MLWNCCWDPLMDDFPNYLFIFSLKKHNPGTVTYIQTDSEDCFKCCFYATGSMSVYVLSKFIITDGAHSKGDFKGTILHAIAMDENNQINTQKKSGLTWTRFLEKLYECIGDCQDLTFVTNRVDAIRVSIENVFPNAHHDMCAFHLLGNIVHHFGKNDKTKRLMRAYKRNVFEDLGYRFSSTRPQVAVYLSEIPHAKWTIAYSPSKRYDYMASNNVMKMPIIPLLDFFCRLSQEWCNKRHIDGGMNLIWTLFSSNNKLIIYMFFTWKCSTMLTEWDEKLVSKNEERTTGWSISGVSDAIYQVHDFKHGGIARDLYMQILGRNWYTLWSCHNGLKALEKSNFGHLAMDAYKMETYRSTYEEAVYSLLELCDWKIPDEMMVVKPTIMDAHQTGRPKNKIRISSQGEEPIVRSKRSLEKVVWHQVIRQNGKVRKGLTRHKRCTGHKRHTRRKENTIVQCLI
uniref:MULE transposase domain-containing protein n=1 Tax=Lactuca sativa TaxID=4236 RepID=A0A9R1X918_LACSA|nr:hypothetical protein LSAT_V11C600329740 [Lactuca sativa]